METRNSGLISQSVCQVTEHVHRVAHPVRFLPWEIPEQVEAFLVVGSRSVVFWGCDGVTGRDMRAFWGEENILHLNGMIVTQVETPVKTH